MSEPVRAGNCVRCGGVTYAGMTHLCTTVAKPAVPSGVPRDTSLEPDPVWEANEPSGVPPIESFLDEEDFAVMRMDEPSGAPAEDAILVGTAGDVAALIDALTEANRALVAERDRLAEEKAQAYDLGRDSILNEIVCSVCGENHDRDESSACDGCEPITWLEFFSSLKERAERAEEQRDRLAEDLKAISRARHRWQVRAVRAEREAAEWRATAETLQDTQAMSDLLDGAREEVAELRKALAEVAAARREFDLAPAKEGFDFVSSFWFLVSTAEAALASAAPSGYTDDQIATLGSESTKNILDGEAATGGRDE